jgi:twitching motility protein PilJ
MNFSFKSWGSPNTWLFIFISVLLLLFLSMLAIFYQVSVDSKHDEVYLRQVTQLRLLSQQITQQASIASKGKESGFKAIITKSKEFQDILELLKDEEKPPITPAEAKGILNELIEVWQKNGYEYKTTPANARRRYSTLWAIYRIDAINRRCCYPNTSDYQCHGGG